MGSMGLSSYVTSTLISISFSYFCPAILKMSSIFEGWIFYYSLKISSAITYSAY